MKALRALIINCTLKPSPTKSETEALVKKVIASYKELGVTTELIRIADYNIKSGTKTNMGKGDEWPAVLRKIKQCDICIIATPIWLGHAASTVQRIFERLDDIFYNKQLTDKKTGQFFTYNKVAGALITGNEDGAHEAARHILWGMQELGFTIPPNSNSYWVGLAGGDENYTDGGGEKHEYTNKNNLYVVHNTIHLANILRETPFPTDFKAIDKEAKKESK